MTWQPKNWERLRKLPADLNPTEPGDAENGPPAQVDVFAGGNIRWADVTVPKGLEVVDQRLEAHGFAREDGIVLEGKVFDLATHKPVAARISLQRVEPQPKGGYRYPVAAETVADAQGRWVLKKSPPGWHRVVIEATALCRGLSDTLNSTISRYGNRTNVRCRAPHSFRAASPTTQASRWRTSKSSSGTLRPTAAAATNRRMSIRSRPMPLATFGRIRFLLEARPSGSTSQAIAARARTADQDAGNRCCAHHDQVRAHHHHRRLRGSRAPQEYIVKIDTGRR